MGSGSYGSGAFSIASASSISQLDSADVEAILLHAKNLAVCGVTTVKMVRTDGKKVTALRPI